MYTMPTHMKGYVNIEKEFFYKKSLKVLNVRWRFEHFCGLIPHMKVNRTIFYV